MIVPRPVDLHEANDFIASFHRHNKPVRGAKFCIGAAYDGVLVGVAVVGRPVARELQDGTTAEVTRCCTDGIERFTADRRGEQHPLCICSFLYAACWRAWRAMGGAKLVTYTLKAESGASLRGAGWRIVAELDPRNPRQWQNRGAGREWHGATGQAKFRWEASPA